MIKDSKDSNIELTEAHAVSQYTTTTMIFDDFFNRLKASVPHKFNTLHLMLFQLFHQLSIDRN